jgi:hypothetical protein
LREIDESWLVPDTAVEAPLKKFAPDEMLTCADCLRLNAPTRAQCMYCGASLNEAAAAPDVETVTDAETGEARHYVVVLDAQGPIDWRF